VHQTIRHVFPDALVAPSIMLGGSDNHYYALVADNTYGFLPQDIVLEFEPPATHPPSLSNQWTILSG